MNVAFVLLHEAAEPDPDLIAEAFAGLFPDRGPLVPTGAAPAASDVAEDDGPPAISLAGADGMLHVLLAAEPVPEGAAERAAGHSLAAIGQEEDLPEHHAHLIVAWFPAEGQTPTEDLAGQARATAAVTLAAEGAIAVYVGAADATHPAQWYVDVAKEVEDPAMLWIGVSHAITDDDRHSFLSFGMHQFALPDLLLTAPLEDGSDAIEYFYGLVTYSSMSGATIAPGEIVGREPGELLTARMEPNPVDDEMTVIAIDLPNAA